MNLSQNGLNFIKKWEGGPWLIAKRFGNEKYLSIGYGHYGSDVKVGQKITKDQAEELLKKDVSKHVSHVNTVNDKYNYNFTQNEFDALVSFSYNIGSINQLTANGSRSKSVIASKMLLYNKSGGKVLPGLTNRRKAENVLFLSKESLGGNKFMIDNEMPVVSHGKSGEYVKTLQILLKAKGFKGADGKVLALDGNAGNNTIYAIKNYQKKYSLSVDGMCGPATWRKILKG